eukprot:GFUD01013916.1.p1 GENE.GFUD01013916.1~~GFUD01013916.1.p1  ORF type:complete len:347 (+),score=57.65 GFUD01013916.1:69-1043(+)
MGERLDVDKPLWDQSTFIGRFKHFAWMTNPLSSLSSTSQLTEAKTLVQEYRVGAEPPGTSTEQVKRAMQLYKSAFHPDSGELGNVFGRMSFQVPGGMMITGAMLQFYKSVPQVVFWQWFNQSFNALVNYTNRNANAPTSTTQLGVAYFSATFSALGTAIGLKKIVEKSSNKLLQRFVPMVAVASANLVNIPLMRQLELMDGITVTDANGEVACQSRVAAKEGIAQVVFSRVAIVVPGMFCLPLIMEKMETKAWFKSRPFFHGPFQVLGVGCFLVLMVPLGCSIFPQYVTISAEKLKSSDLPAYKQLSEKYGENIPDLLYYNKGL